MLGELQSLILGTGQVSSVHSCDCSRHLLFLLKTPFSEETGSIILINFTIWSKYNSLNTEDTQFHGQFQLRKIYPTEVTGWPKTLSWKHHIYRNSKFGFFFYLTGKNQPVSLLMRITHGLHKGDEHILNYLDMRLLKVNSDFSDTQKVTKEKYYLQI